MDIIHFTLGAADHLDSHQATARGRITVTTFHTPMRIDILGGMGCLLAKDEPYSLTSDRGAILLIVESDQLIAHEPGANCGAKWPGDNVT
jgi:hypothetical protein